MCLEHREVVCCGVFPGGLVDVVRQGVESRQIPREIIFVILSRLLCIGLSELVTGGLSDSPNCIVPFGIRRTGEWAIDQNPSKVEG